MNKTNLVFLTSELTTNSKEENRKAFKEICHFLKNYDYNFQIVQGVYKGNSEPCLMVGIGDNIGNNLTADIHTSANVASIYGQESILLVNRDNSSELLYPSTNKREYLGKMRQVSEYTIKNNNIDAYTIINGNYYTTL